MQPYPTRLIFRPSAAVRKAAGADLGEVARRVLEAVLKQGPLREIAHLQISHSAFHYALSSRIGSRGQLILDVDIGLPELAGRVILEDDLRRAERMNGPVPRHARQRFAKSGKLR